MVVKEGNLVTKSHVGVTDVTNHSFPTTFAFINKLMADLMALAPHATTVHFVTDWPSSQYRNRYVIQLLLEFEAIYEITAICNLNDDVSECNHTENCFTLGLVNE